nr:unnamed protein product [Haemonchus contortus]
MKTAYSIVLVVKIVDGDAVKVISGLNVEVRLCGFVVNLPPFMDMLLKIEEDFSSLEDALDIIHVNADSETKSHISKLGTTLVV